MTIQKLFLSIGAMRSGTTWLHRQLANHRQLEFTPEKEIHYWAAPDGTSYPMRLADRIARFKRVMSNVTPERYNPQVQANLVWYASKYLTKIIDKDWYQNLFDGTKDDTWCADFSNLTGLLDKEGWQRVEAGAEDVRAIYTLRHPAQRMWSQVKFHHMYGQIKTDLHKWSRQDFETFFANPSAEGHCLYASNIQRARSAVPGLPLKVVFFENLRHSPQEGLNDIEAFLDIEIRDYRTHNLESAINPSSKDRIPKAFENFVRSRHEAECEALQKLNYQLPIEWLKQD